MQSIIWIYPDEPLKLLMFYGVGGIGKTAPQLKLIDSLRKNKKTLPFVRLNIEEVRVKTGDPSEALLRLRTFYEADFGVKFPLFDLCLDVITAHQGSDPEPHQKFCAEPCRKFTKCRREIMQRRHVPGYLRIFLERT